MRKGHLRANQNRGAASKIVTSWPLLYPPTCRFLVFQTLFPYFNLVYSLPFKHQDTPVLVILINFSFLLASRQVDFYTLTSINSIEYPLIVVA